MKIIFQSININILLNLRPRYRGNGTLFNWLFFLFSHFDQKSRCGLVKLRKKTKYEFDVRKLIFFKVNINNFLNGYTVKTGKAR